MFGNMMNSEEDSNDANWQFKADEQISLLRKLGKKYPELYQNVSLSMSAGHGKIPAFERLFKGEPELGDYCYYYEFLFEKLLMPEFWAERAGLKDVYETQAVVFAA